jgi:hypothetical protein
MAMKKMEKTRTHFTYRIDTWTKPEGKNIVGHVAGVEDFQLALATVRAACECWPNTPITLRHGARVIEDSRRPALGLVGQRPARRTLRYTTKIECVRHRNLSRALGVSQAEPSKNNIFVRSGLRVPETPPLGPGGVLVSATGISPPKGRS